VFRELLIERVSAFYTLSSEQIDRLEQHYELMVRWNKTINLTRIDGIEDAVDRHYAESLFLASQLPQAPLRIADVGSGAGFPGFPIAVVRPDCHVTLIESHKRKAVFLKEATRSVPSIAVAAQRAEDISQVFDWIVSRAVSWEDLEKFVGKLAPNLALLCTNAPRASKSIIPVPIVSRETSLLVIA
jgi:16S rRNA (guanine527-N7)-methyltransferase